MSKMDWESYGIVIGSQHRKSVVLSLFQRPRSPGEISHDVGLPPSRVSRILKELDNRNLVVCLTPNLRKGRVYQLTGLGTQIARYLEAGGQDTNLTA